MQRRIATVLLVLYTLIVFGTGFVAGQTRWSLLEAGLPALLTPDDAKETFAPFWETWSLVHTHYFDQPVDDEKLAQGAIEGMLAKLNDPNTRYLSPAEEEQIRENMTGEIEGIGVIVEMVDGNVTIVSPFEGSPAAEAGLEPGDILRQADGVDLTGKDLTEVTNLVRGPAGTTVTLAIERDGRTFTVKVTRDVIEIPSVRGEMLEENLAYVRLSRFRANTAEEIQATLEELLLLHDPAGLILDLRNNPGGGLESVVDIADQFLGEGVVLIERFGNGEERVFESTDEGLAETIPMVVLINEGSASASEVLAGAIRDRERGILIGQTSFGKGTVQSWQSLSNGGGVRITVARWLTPDGTWVHEEGLTPDQEVPLPDTAQAPDEEIVDTQLQAAITYLTGREAGVPG